MRYNNFALAGMLTTLVLLLSVPLLAQELPEISPPTPEEVVQRFCQLLVGETDEQLVSALIDSMKKIDPSGKTALLKLEEILETEEAPAKLVNAIKAVSAYGVRAKHMIPLLVQLAGRPNKNVSNAAFQTLGVVGAWEREDMDFFVKLLSHPNPDVREKAVTLLGKFGPKARKVLPDLLPLAQDEYPRVRAAVAWALGQILAGTPNPPDKTVKQAVERLIGLLDDGDDCAKASAARALGKIGPAANVAVPKLIELLKDGRWYDVNNAAREALEAIWTPQPKDLGQLVELLGCKDADVRAWAARALGQLGGSAREALPALLPLAQDENSDVRFAVAEALGQILARSSSPTDKTVKQAVEELVGLLGDGGDCVKGAAARALGEIGPAANAAVPKLIELISDGGWCSKVGGDVSDIAREALKAIGTPRPEDLDRLVVLLGDIHADVRAWAVRALGQLGGSAREALPALLPLAQDEDSDVRFAVAEALGRILTPGPVPVEAEQAFLRLLSDSYRNVRKAALQAVAEAYAEKDVCSRAIADLILRQYEGVYDKTVRAAWVAAASCFLKGVIDKNKNLFALGFMSSEVRAGAARMLGWIGSAANSAVLDLMTALDKETVPQVLNAIVQALEEIKTPREEDVDRLIDYLKNEQPLVRKEAVYLLGNLSKPLPRVVIVLLDVLKNDPVVEVRIEAASALGKLFAAQR